eukprot:scaffold1063_cov128-Isochrysis_galbana.AAC.4
MESFSTQLVPPGAAAQLASATPAVAGRLIPTPGAPGQELRVSCRHTSQSRSQRSNRSRCLSSSKPCASSCSVISAFMR